MAESTRETPSQAAPTDLGAASIIASATQPNVPARKASIDEFLKRNAEVLEKDRAEFQTYLIAKQEAATGDGAGADERTS